MTTLQKKIRNLKHDASPFSKSRIIKDANEIKTLIRHLPCIDGMSCIVCKIHKNRTKRIPAAVHIDDPSFMRWRGKFALFDTGYASVNIKSKLFHAQLNVQLFSKSLLDYVFSACIIDAAT